jgi:hypothetical protein
VEEIKWRNRRSKKMRRKRMKKRKRIRRWTSRRGGREGRLTG